MSTSVPFATERFGGAFFGIETIEDGDDLSEEDEPDVEKAVDALIRGKGTDFTVDGDDGDDGEEKMEDDGTSTADEAADDVFIRAMVVSCRC